jgi:hypothetical protein
MFSRPNHHQRRQQGSPPRPIRESLRSYSLKNTQQSTKNKPTKESTGANTNANPTQHKRTPHTNTKTESTEKPDPANAHLQTADTPTATEDANLLELLLKSALAALVATRSTSPPNSASELSKDAKITLAELNRLANAATPEANNIPNAKDSQNSRGVQTVSTYVDAVKSGQAKNRETHTQRPLPPAALPRTHPKRNHPGRHSPYRLIVRWPGHTIPASATALTDFVDNLENDINPDFIHLKRPGTKRIAAANVTRSGNLVIHTKAPYTASQLKIHTQDIHVNAKAIPGFSPPDNPPLVELDLPWHGLVVHGLPTLSLREAYYSGEDYDDDKNIWDSLEMETGIPQTEIRDLRILCRDGEEEKQSSLSLRIMVEDPAIGDRLIRDGAFLLGTHCRVSQYHPRRTTPLSKPHLHPMPPHLTSLTPLQPLQP